MHNQKKLSGGFLAIIVFKYSKAVIFLLVGIAALKLSRSDPFPTAVDLARFFRSSPENELIKLTSSLTPGWALGIGFVSLFVGAVFGTEATLLTMRVWWSTYFTIVLTALGIPLEIFEILRRPTGYRRYLILAVNVAILLYLWMRRNEFRGLATTALRRSGARR
jgi:uncharacterized membrane protein (DUF2068 family)